MDPTIKRLIVAIIIIAIIIIIFMMIAGVATGGGLLYYFVLRKPETADDYARRYGYSQCSLMTADQCSKNPGFVPVGRCTDLLASTDQCALTQSGNQTLTSGNPLGAVIGAGIGVFTGAVSDISNAVNPKMVCCKK